MSLKEIMSIVRNTFVEIMTKLGIDSWYVVVMAIILLTLDIILMARMNKARNIYMVNEENSDTEDSHRYVDYYKRKQYIQTIRWIIRAVAILSFIIYHNPNIFAGLAIAIWAFVITFWSVFLSLWIYLYLISFYSPGQSIKIGERIGEIVSITPLYLKLLGKNQSGDHTGELVNIPNHKIWQEHISLIDLDLASIEKTLFDIPYHANQHEISFKDFVKELRAFLDNLFPINTAKTIGHYKSYKWYKYKLSFSLNDKWQSIVHVWFLSKRSKTSDYLYQIITFYETLRRQNDVVTSQ